MILKQEKEFRTKHTENKSKTPSFCLNQRLATHLAASTLKSPYCMKTKDEALYVPIYLKEIYVAYHLSAESKTDLFSKPRNWALQ